MGETCLAKSPPRSQEEASSGGNPPRSLSQRSRQRSIAFDIYTGQRSGMAYLRLYWWQEEADWMPLDRSQLRLNRGQINLRDASRVAYVDLIFEGVSSVPTAASVEVSSVTKHIMLKCYTHQLDDGPQVFSVKLDSLSGSGGIGALKEAVFDAFLHVYVHDRRGNPPSALGQYRVYLCDVAEESTPTEDELLSEQPVAFFARTCLVGVMSRPANYTLDQPPVPRTRDRATVYFSPPD